MSLLRCASVDAAAIGGFVESKIFNLIAEDAQKRGKRRFSVASGCLEGGGETGFDTRYSVLEFLRVLQG